MKKFLLLFFVLISIFSFSITDEEYGKINKMVNQILSTKKDAVIEYNDKSVVVKNEDNQIFLTLNSAKETFINKTVISQKKGKLKPVIVDYLGKNEVNEYKMNLNNAIDLYFLEPDVLYYLNQNAKLSREFKELIKNIDNIEQLIFLPDGIIKVTYSIDHKDNKVVIEKYVENTLIQKSYFFLDEDYLVGYNETYYPNGQIRLRMPIAKGSINGEVTRYYENGTLALEGKAKDMYPDGKFKIYNKDGSLRTEKEITLEELFQLFQE